MELTRMYPVEKESTIMQITNQITATATTIPVVDASVFPNAPNIATIFDKYGTARETVRYEGKAGNSLTSVTRGFYGTTAQAWPVGTDITRALSGYDHDTFLENIDLLKESIESLDGGGNGEGETFFKIDPETLSLQNGTLSVNVTDEIRAGSNRPVKSGAVHNALFDIEKFLEEL